MSRDRGINRSALSCVSHWATLCHRVSNTNTTLTIYPDRRRAESKEPINHSNKIKRLLMLAGFIYYVLFAIQLQQEWLPCCYRIQNQGGSFKSSENVFIYFAQLPDLRAPHLFLLSGQCRVVSDQLSARESRDLAPIKLVSTLHFNLYPRSPPSLQRRPTLSGWDYY